LNPIFGQLLLQLLLISLNAVFACAEIAVISVSDAKTASLAAKGDKRAIRLARLNSQPAVFLATIQVAITLSGFLGSAFAADNFSERLVRWAIGLGITISPSTLGTIAVVVITLILSYITLVFGELIPKRLAMKNAEKMALKLSGLICFFSVIFKPVVSLLTVSTNGILRLLGVDPDADDEEVSEEEILMLVDAGNQKGIFDSNEQRFIQNIFEFDDITVGEFATHRTDIVVLWVDETLEQWRKTASGSRFSRYLICDETIDNVVGVIKMKDLFAYMDSSKEEILQKCMKTPYFIPESLFADELFRRMQSSRNHFAVVLDEYGGTFGIVTMNDLLEQLVGSLDDEDTPIDEINEIQQLDTNTWKIRGSAYLDDVAEKLGIALPLEEYDTFGGYVFGTYGSFPADGSTFELDSDGLHIKVTDIKAHKIENAVVCIDGSQTEG